MEFGQGVRGKAYRQPPDRHGGREVVQTNYVSQPVFIATDFLSSPPPSTYPAVTYSKIDFATSPLPEYRGLYAAVLDNVLSPAECQELLHLAELSAGAHTGTSAQHSGGRDDQDGWQPALLRSSGLEFKSNKRNSDRIIWDSIDIADRIWSRCLLEPQVLRDLAVIEGNEKESILGYRAVSSGHRWKLTRLNERLRFLRYGRGQFFRPHCDQFYETPDRKEKTFYTLHLYLNDSVQGTRNKGVVRAGSPSPLSFPTCNGGATTFHSTDRRRRLDVFPVAGRVLIFQHAKLLHSGDDVKGGTKYTLRSDLLYEFDGWRRQ